MDVAVAYICSCPFCICRKSPPMFVPVHPIMLTILSTIFRSVQSKTSAILPKKTLHRYFFSNIGDIFIIPSTLEDYASVAQLVTENFVNKYGQKVSPQKAWDSI